MAYLECLSSLSLSYFFSRGESNYKKLEESEIISTIIVHEEWNFLPLVIYTWVYLFIKSYSENIL